MAASKSMDFPGAKKSSYAAQVEQGQLNTNPDSGFVLNWLCSTCAAYEDFFALGKSIDLEAAMDTLSHGIKSVTLYLQ